MIPVSLADGLGRTPKTEQDSAGFALARFQCQELELREQSLVLHEVDVVLKLGEGASRDVKKPSVIVFASPPTALGDIGWYGDSTTNYLAEKPFVMRREILAGAIRKGGELIGLLPRDQVPKPSLLAFVDQL